MRGLVLFAALVAVAYSQNSIGSCKTSFEAAIRTVTDRDDRCGSLVMLSSCFASISTLTDQDKWQAQGYIDSLQFQEQCTNFVQPDFPPTVDSVDNSLVFTVDGDHDVVLNRARRAESISIWGLYDEVATITSATADACKDDDLNNDVNSIQGRINTLLSSLSKNFDDKVAATKTQTQTSLSSIDSGFRTAASSMNKLTIDRTTSLQSSSDSLGNTINTSTKTKIESVRTSTMGYLSTIKSAAAVNSSAIINKYSSALVAAQGSFATEFSALKKSNDDLIAGNSLNAKILSGNLSTSASFYTSLDVFIGVFQNHPYVNKRLPVYRYNVWSTYSYTFSWMAGNNNNYFGGVHPSTWSDGNGNAYDMSSSKDVLRTLFTKRGYGGWSATVWAQEWYYYSSTDSKLIGVLFRIKNNTPSAITWTAYWYFSSFASWSEIASVNFNGNNAYRYTGDCAMCSTSIGFSIPGNRISTVIFVNSSGGPSGTRTSVSAFYNDCLNLPTGLEYADDLDTVGGDWST